MSKDLDSLSLTEIQRLLELIVTEEERLEHRLNCPQRDATKDFTRMRRLATLRQIVIPRYREERNKLFEQLRSRLPQSL